MDKDIKYNYNMDNNNKMNTFEKEDNEEDNEEVEEEEDKEEDELEEEEIDEDYRKLFMNSYTKNINNLYDEKMDKCDNKEKLPKKLKQNKSLSLSDFYNLTTVEEENNKPKRFVSKRVSEKRKTIEPVMNKTESIRKFNPRYPAYNIVKNVKQENTMIYDDDFPVLKKEI